MKAKLGPAFVGLTALAGFMLSGACQQAGHGNGPTAPDRAAPSHIVAAEGAAPGTSYPAEHAYYNGRIYLWAFPTQKSNDPHELRLGPDGCFRAGIIPRQSSAAPTVRLYAIHLAGATLHHCPGEPTVAVHDHLLSAVPGVPGYSSHWQVWNVFPGPDFDPDHSPMPITSIAQLEAAAAAGEVVIQGPGPVLEATVLGPAE